MTPTHTTPSPRVHEEGASFHPEREGFSSLLGGSAWPWLRVGISVTLSLLPFRLLKIGPKSDRVTGVHDPS